MSAHPHILIIGAGLAGLSCARELAARGCTVEIIEAADRVGGRVATDRFEGFTLDRGFQVFLTAYPEAGRALDYGGLSLRPFYAGALVRSGGRFHRLADPFRHPLDALPAVFSHAGTLADKLRVGRLRGRVARGPIEAIFDREERTTAEALRREAVTIVYSAAARIICGRRFASDSQEQPYLRLPLSFGVFRWLNS